MVKHSEIETNSSIDEVTGDQIKNELHKVVSHLTGSENVELYIEPGSKKGNSSFVL